MSINRRLVKWITDIPTIESVAIKIEVGLYALMWNNFQKIQTFNNAYFLGIALRVRERNVNFDLKYI